MKDTLFRDDIIIVNKLKYNSFPNFLTKSSALNLSDKKGIETDSVLQLKKDCKYTNVKTGDILVFKRKTVFSFVKRCIGLPGDSLTINNAQIFLNGILFNESKLIKKKFETKMDYNKLRNILDSLGISAYTNHTIFNQNSLKTINLTLNDKEKINSLLSSNYLKLAKSKNKLFVNVFREKWNLDNFGPIFIPKKGTQIELNKYNFLIYKSILAYHEQVNISFNKNTFYVNGKKSQSYTFKKNYFFLIGDNRSNSIDSRSWGFVPEENIIGKVQCVLYSYHGGQFNWNRFLKGVD